MLVPQADGGARSVTVVAYGMRIDARLDPLSLGPSQGRLQHLVARPSGRHLFGVDILQPVPVDQRLPQPLRRVGFTRPQHVGVLLLVGCQSQVVKAHVAVDEIPRQDALSPFRPGLLAIAGHLEG